MCPMCKKCEFTRIRVEVSPRRSRNVAVRLDVPKRIRDMQLRIKLETRWCSACRGASNRENE